MIADTKLPDPNTVGWWAMKDGVHVDFCPTEKFEDADEANYYFFHYHGQGVVFHHGNRAGLRPTPA